MNALTSFSNNDPRSRFLALANIPLLTLLSCCPLPGAHANTNVNNYIDFNRDNLPDILWHNRSSGANRLWSLNGANVAAAIEIQPPVLVPEWKMVGTGFFQTSAPTNRGIVWQNETTQEKAVWFMDGTNYLTAGFFPIGDTNYDIVGIADFNGDHKSDLILQHRTSNPSRAVIWLMNGTTIMTETTIYSGRMPLAWPDVNWRIVATGDFNKDGKADLILHHITDGRTAVWYLNQTNLTSGAFITDGISAIRALDFNFKIVGAGDFDDDGQTDILWRHAVDGRTFFWKLANKGSRLVQPVFLPIEPDQSWRLASQPTGNSDQILTNLTATAATTSITNVNTIPSVKAEFVGANVLLTFYYPLSLGNEVLVVQRKPTSNTAWQNLVTNLTTLTFTDSTVASGTRYDYRFYGLLTNQNPAITNLMSSTVAVTNGPPIENRGKIVLLIDNTIVSPLDAQIAQLRQDLIGDGWMVVTNHVPRHIDDYSSSNSYQTNAWNITNVIKPYILGVYTNDPVNTKAVYLLGHVAVPYSGYRPADGHVTTASTGPIHVGAWATDLYYGDVTNDVAGADWTDSTANHTSVYFAENVNVPGDGKFDNDFCPSRLELAVGRVDFARLPSFGTSNQTSTAEINLLAQYLTKVHRYRHNLTAAGSSIPWRTGMAYLTRNDLWSSYETPLRLARTLYGDLPDNVAIGDPYFQRTEPHVWGFAYGSSGQDRISYGDPIFEHTTASLAFAANEAKIGFYVLGGSFFGDWNLTDDFLRANLATANYGFAAMYRLPNALRWDFANLELGEHLGAAQVRTVNYLDYALYSPANAGKAVSLQGDPTLRSHVCAPVQSLTGMPNSGEVFLSWSAGSTNTVAYRVYKAPAGSNVFSPISSFFSSPTSFTDSIYTSGQTYMVRAFEVVKRGAVLSAYGIGTGSYTNVSQGIYWPTPPP
ncbi:MAG: VCBS repeat-containing protein [Verrucomicrobia bacterium]|nr:VCBS repeat-containing protein [Verrucomicrobiota bacterium]